MRLYGFGSRGIGVELRGKHVLTILLRGAWPRYFGIYIALDMIASWYIGKQNA